MKWFKHITDSLEDPFIFDLVSRYGGDGYLVFFGILEIYSREFKTEDNWKLNVTRAYLRQKLNKRQDTLIAKSLEHIHNSGKWSVSFNGENVTIFIPKFRELLDESTLKKLRDSEKSFRNCSGSIPKNAPTDIDIDKDIYVEGAKEVLSYLNETTGRGFKDYSFIIPRLKDGATVAECMRVIDVKAADPHFRDNPKYLCPQTLFRKSHWDKYLQETELMKEKFI